jgi:predicted CoA-binding protein
LKRTVIRSRRVAKELLSKGFTIIDIAPDRVDSKRTVFVFEDNETLQKCLDRIISEV